MNIKLVLSIISLDLLLVGAAGFALLSPPVTIPSPRAISEVSVQDIPARKGLLLAPLPVDEVRTQALFGNLRRQPKQEPEAALAPPVTPELPPQLVGILFSEPERIALLRSRESVIRAHEGTEVDGWSVIEVGMRSIVIKRGDKRHVIPLDSRTSAAATP